jgi:tetratricopeptide (TPR) repeat protein
VKVKGRLAGQPFERSYAIEEEDESVAALVPRLWAAANMKKILGEGGGADEQRGTLVKLGLDYGLMTPFTSFLALESEQAYAAQGIARKRGPAFGRLATAEKKEATEESDRAMLKGHAGEPPAPTLAVAPAAPARQLASAPAEEEGIGVGGLGTKDKGGGRGSIDDLLDGVEKRPAASRPQRAMAKIAATRSRADLSRSDALATGAPEARRSVSTVAAIMPAACSDASERPLFERALLWMKRLQTATAPGELAERYRAAIAACELPDWRAEALFLRLLAHRMETEAAVAEIFDFLGPRPDARFYLARVLLRRNAGDALALAIEQRLFGTRVPWDKVDLELSAIGNVETRIARLKEYLARAPNDPAGGMRLVKLLARAGHADEALLFSRKLKAAGLLTPRLVLALGDLQADAGQTDDAIRTYSEIVEFDPRNQAARQLLGDVYLAHGWYDLAYAQYTTLTEMAPENLLAWLRLAAAAAGAGRTDEALRIERKVARSPGNPGPSDPRLFARLAAAAHMARLMAEPPKDVDGKRLIESMSRDLAELQLFQGPGTMVLLSWEDLGADLIARAGGKSPALAGETTDAATVGLSALLLPAGKRGSVPLQAHLRSAPPSRPLKLVVCTIDHDGKTFQVNVKRVELAPGQVDVGL